eukprot:PhF_6_TR34975/c0_g1_i1/m.50794
MIFSFHRVFFVFVGFVLLATYPSLGELEGEENSNIIINDENNNNNNVDDDTVQSQVNNVVPAQRSYIHSGKYHVHHARDHHAMMVDQAEYLDDDEIKKFGPPKYQEEYHGEQPVGITMLRGPNVNQTIWDAIIDHEAVAIFIRTNRKICTVCPTFEGDFAMARTRFEMMYGHNPKGVLQDHKRSGGLLHSVGWFAIDISEPGSREIIHDLMMETLMHDYIAPGALVCKRDQMLNPRRPPVFVPAYKMFMWDVIHILHNLVHPEVVPVRHIEEVPKLVHGRTSDGLVFFLWNNASRDAFYELAHEFHADFMFFVDMTTLEDGAYHPTDIEFYNPQNSSVVSVFAKPNITDHSASNYIVNSTNVTDYVSLFRFVNASRFRRQRHAVDKVKDFRITTWRSRRGCDERAAFGADVKMSYLGFVHQHGGSHRWVVFHFNTSVIDLHIGYDQHVVEGIQKSIEGKCPGDEMVVTIPPELGYGRRGYPPYVPGNAVLMAYVKLHAITMPAPLELDNILVDEGIGNEGGEGTDPTVASVVDEDESAHNEV